MSDEDFPAAHSMDTEWFAVDAEGNIGIFESGEAGAVPATPAGSGIFVDGAPSVAELLQVLPPEIAVEYDVDDMVAMQGGPVLEFRLPWHVRETISFSDTTSVYHVLMLLPDERLLGSQAQSTKPVTRGFWQTFLGRGSKSSASEAVNVVKLPNSKYVLGYIDGPVLVGTLQQWIQERLVEKAWVNHTLSHARIGIYLYEHGDIFENWIAGPYLRETAPSRPLKIDQLPENFRAMFETTRFENLSFARDTAIDPRELGECNSWDRSWVGLDGIVHREPEDGDGEGR